MRFLWLASIIATIVAAQSCPRSVHGGELLASADVQRGFWTRTYRDAAGESHRYVLFVPYSYEPGKKLPVLMFLNGRGENGDDGVRQISNNFGPQVWNMQEFFPFLTIMPQCRKDGSWSAGSLDVQWALEILDEVVQEFAADEDRICLTGVSSGGSGVWSIGSAHRERFAALAPLCGNGGDVGQLVEARMPVWNFINNGDGAGLVEGSRRMRFELIRKGMSPLFMEYPQLGHNCWNATYRMTALYGWLLEQRRSRNSQATLFTYLPPTQLLDAWSQKPSGNWTVGEEETLIGRSDGGESLLVSDFSSEAVEVHGDVWLSSESGREVALVVGGSTSSEQGYRLSLMLPAQGTGGLYRPSDGAWIAELDPAAQHWLQPDAWNDVRLRLYHGTLEVRLNGWPAMNVELGSDDFGGGFRFALVAAADVPEVRWRFLRVRELTDDPRVGAGESSQ